MFKKYLTVIIAVLLINLTLGSSVFANSKDDKFAAKIKANVAKLGVGKDALIEVKLKDGTKLKGYCSEINDESFAVTDKNSQAATEVPYSKAKQVKGNNLSTGVKIAIGVGIALAVIVLIEFLAPSR